MGSRRRVPFVALLSVGALLSASMLAPAFGAPEAVSAVSLAKKLSRTLKIAKRADRNAKRAIAGLETQGGQGAAGPAGPKGDKGEPGAVGNAGPAGPKGDKGDACPSSDPACRGPQGSPGTNGTNETNGTDGEDGAQGPPGPSAINLNVNLANSNAQELTVGAFALRFNCSGAAPNFRQFILGVKGAGGAQARGREGHRRPPEQRAPVHRRSPDVAGLVHDDRDHRRQRTQSQRHLPALLPPGRALVMHNGLRSATVVYDMFLDDRNNTGTCAFRGSAVLSGLL